MNNDKIRKCTKCVKKFPREELIKCSGSYGGLFCETCAKNVNKISWTELGKIFLIAFAIACFCFWIIFKIADWIIKDKKEYD